MNRRRFALLTVGAVLIMLALADHSGLLLAPRASDMVTYHRVEARLCRVLSPTLIEVEIRDELNRRETTQVLLWGIAAAEAPERPELNAASREAGARNSTHGANALEAAAIERIETLLGSRVTLSLERQRVRDPFARVLAHVELPEGGTLNELLLEAGLVTVDERRPHAMLTRYAQAQNNARRHRRGVWGPSP